MGRILAIWLLVLCVFSPKASADDDWMPGARHYEAASQGGDCAIYRSLAYKARKTIEASDDAELHYTELLKVRRADLGICAQMRGFELDGSEESESLAAEACGEIYQQWVRTGYRLQVSRQDRKGAEKSIAMLVPTLERYCGESAQLAPIALRVRGEDTSP